MNEKWRPGVGAICTGFAARSEAQSLQSVVVQRALGKLCTNRRAVRICGLRQSADNMQ